ncbi:DUF2341 domain-containing protein, partial [Candidatus Dojkabacteria bacterium]|nr:DUF2341 domain-containing protein [Candidatus Dojkabacteria bacterium]
MGVTKKIVILDDNFAIRNVMRTFLRRLRTQLGVDFKVYTSADGVEGLGYIYATDPDIIIVDTTLPKYSGRELLTFLTTNKKFSDPEKGVIIIRDDGDLGMKFPAVYTVLHKSKRTFLRDLLHEVIRIVRRDSIVPKEVQQGGRLLKVGEFTTSQANFSDRILQDMHRSVFLGRAGKWLWWIVTQILISIGLVILQFGYGKPTDDNIEQMNEDEWAYRVRHFPTMVAAIAGSLVVLIQISAYLLGGLALLNLTGRVAPVSAAFSNGYSYRRTVTIDYTKVSGTSNLTNFPVLINGTYSYLATTGNGGKVENSSGFDIIFTSDSAGTTKLDHEIEKYVATTGEIVMWVEVPSVSYTANTTIYLFYGNSSISVTQENKTGVWDSNYKMVQHLHAGTTGNTDFKDSTSNANNSSAVVIDGTGSSATATGKIGTAVQFDGSNDNIAVADSATLDITSSFTISAWAKADTLSAIYQLNAIVAKTGQFSSESAGTDINYALALDYSLSQAGRNQFGVFENSSHLDTSTYVSFTPTTGQWYYYTLVFNDSGNTLTMYRDGSQVSNNASATAVPAANNYPLYIAVENAANQSPPYTDFFDGYIDEVRVSNTNRSAGWVTTEYNNQNSPSTFYSLGTEDASPTVTVSTTGTQTSSMSIPSTNQSVGAAFSLAPAVTSATVTGITITENGTVDAQTDVDNIKLYYELDTSSPYNCASESYAGTETQFGSTDADGFSGANGTSAFTDSVAVTTSQALCVYVVLDIGSGATNSESLEIEISNPSTNVTLSTGTVTPGTAVALSGTTTLSGADVTVSSAGTQISQTNKPISNMYLGAAFSIEEKTSSRNVTGITIREQGSVDASTGLDNIKLYYENDTSAPYDCASESYSATESQFGSTDTDGFSAADGTSAFTGSVGITTTSTMCVYVVMDVTSSASDSQTIDIDIADASTAVTVSSGTVGPAATVALSGSTTINAANWTNGFDYRRAITIDADQVSGSSNHTNFPVLISGTYSGLESSGYGGNVQHPKACDVIFTSDAAGSTQLDHQIEDYTASSGNIAAWVKIPSLSYSTDTTIYMFYGNPGVGDCSLNNTSLWSDFAGVWHMDEDPSGSAPQLLDSTSTAENGTSSGTMTSGDLITGLAKYAWDLDGSNDYAIIPYNSELEPDTMTVSAWIKGTSGSQYNTIVSNRVTATTDWSHRLFFTNTDFVFSINIDGTAGGTTSVATPISTLNNGSWHYVAGTYDGSDARVFIDGVEKNSAPRTSSVLHNAGNDMWIGLQSTSTAYFAGGVEEVRVSSTPRSADWLLTEYNNQISPSTFYAVGEQETGVPDVTVTTTGTQATSVTEGSTNFYVGGAFALHTTNAAATVTGITIAEQGSIDAQNNLDNIKLFYELDSSAPTDCASESFSGSETQFGSTDTDGFSAANGSSAFTGSVALLQSQAMCVYVVLDITTGANPGNTIEVQITNPSTDVSVSTGSVSTSSAVQISGTTTVSAASFGNGYTYSRSLTIDYTKTGGGGVALTNFPILVKGTYSYLATTGNGGNVENANGYDIIFTSDAAGTTKLDHEIEKYVSTTGEVEMWVNVPSVSVTADTTIYMFYGNSSVSYTQENASGLWSGYVGVWHLDEDPSGTAPQVIDYSTNGHNGTSNGTMLTGDLVAGQIGNSLDFDGSDDYISVPAATALEPDTLTFSAWIKTSNSTQYRTVFSNRAAADDDYSYRMNFSGTNLAFTINTDGTSGGAASANVASSSVADGTWHYVTGVYDGSAVYIFLDGTYVTSTAKVSAVLHDSGNDLWIGLQSTSTPYFLGVIDEVRLQSTPRFQAWLLTEYNNQNSPSTFYSLGTEQGGAIADITAASTGSQTSTIAASTTDVYIGGAFALNTANADSSITGITISEQGSIDAQNDLD